MGTFRFWVLVLGTLCACSNQDAIDASNDAFDRGARKSAGRTEAPTEDEASDSEAAPVDAAVATVDGASDKPDSSQSTQPTEAGAQRPDATSAVDAGAVVDAQPVADSSSVDSAVEPDANSCGQTPGCELFGYSACPGKCSQMPGKDCGAVLVSGSYLHACCTEAEFTSGVCVRPVCKEAGRECGTQRFPDTKCCGACIGGFCT